jgi:hypothetical protein
MTACVHPLEITYTIAEDGKSITFQPCGYTSDHPMDVEAKYCAHCHRWMELIELAREMAAPNYWKLRHEKK